MDELTKRKIAYKLRGRKKSARTKWLISNTMRGKEKSKQHKQAISEAMKLFWQQHIINGVKVLDRESLIEIGVGNLKRIKEYTLLIRQKKAERNKSAGLSMIAYNKSREIVNNPQKEYISQTYGNSKRLYRLEVRINSDSLKAFLDNEHLLFKGEMLYNKDYLWLFFLTFLNRIIRFQSFKGRKVYGVLDLI